MHSAGPLPAPEELLLMAREVGHDYPRWRSRLTAPADEGSWVRLFRAGPLGIWAVDWDRVPPGTCYLDHERVRGAVWVARGALAHECARFGSAPRTTRVPAASGFCFDETFYHRMRALDDAGPTVTVHVFASLLPPPPPGAPLTATALHLPSGPPGDTTG